MGQAQLLLIVLGVVLVGIAIIAGIQAYDQNNRKASVDALTHDAIRMASDLQVWAQRPEQFGGPETHGDYQSGTLTDIGYSDPYSNVNGSCTLSSGVITCKGATLDTEVEVTVTGLSDEDIERTNVSLGGGASSGGSDTSGGTE